KDISETNKPGDVILDSITNLPGYSVDYKIVAGVYVKMYSLVGNKSSKKIFTIRKGTLADYNARLYALLTGKDEVINTTPDEAIREARRENLALVGIEVEVGDSFEEEMARLNSWVPSCMIYSKIDAEDVLKAYKEGIRIIKEDPKGSALIISSLSKYYTQEVMERIIGIYNHALTQKKEDLLRSIEVYSKVLPSVKKLKIDNT
ncbi:hypothetical protein DJ528_12090, partial [Sulfolobus sp. B5]